MPITINGNTYRTVSDAAKELGGVSAKTVRDWIKKGIIDEPPLLEHGVRIIQHFPEDYIKKAKGQLKYYREHKRLERKEGNTHVHKSGVN
jgi:predicted site-specific integrase-resolvase